MLDLMFKATDKASWDIFVSALPNAVSSDLLIDEIGPVVITPAVFDDQGNVVEEGVISLSHHVNLRLLSDNAVVAASLSAGGPGVEWIDPALVSTPARIWAGGMSYWKPD